MSNIANNFSNTTRPPHQLPPYTAANNTQNATTSMNSSFIFDNWRCIATGFVLIIGIAVLLVFFVIKPSSTASANGSTSSKDSSTKMRGNSGAAGQL